MNVTRGQQLCVLLGFEHVESPNIQVSMKRAWAWLFVCRCGHMYACMQAHVLVNGTACADVNFCACTCDAN